jgi:hypothetical protein
MFACIWFVIIEFTFFGDAFDFEAHTKEAKMLHGGDQFYYFPLHFRNKR